jgi:hypothetical protein
LAPLPIRTIAAFLARDGSAALCVRGCLTRPASEPRNRAGDTRRCGWFVFTSAITMSVRSRESASRCSVENRPYPSPKRCGLALVTRANWSRFCVSADFDSDLDLRTRLNAAPEPAISRRFDPRRGVIRTRLLHKIAQPSQRTPPRFCSARYLMPGNLFRTARDRWAV